MSSPINLPSGARLEIHLAAPEAAFDLLDKTTAELRAVNLDLSSLNLEELEARDINVVKNLVCQFLGSRPLRDAVFACAAGCLYNEQRITRETFMPAEARADFFPVAWGVIKANLAPFFAGLGSLSGASRSPIIERLKSILTDSQP